MRKLAALALAVPVVLPIYLAALLRRTATTRIGAGIGASAVLAFVVVASLPPAQSTASPASEPAPVTGSMLNAVTTGHPLTDPFVVRFDAPMDAASVAAGMRLDPAGAYSLQWDAAGTTLSIAPVDAWQPDTLYSITIGDAARSVSGAVLATPVRALFLTDRAGTATIAATRAVGGKVALDTAFRVDLDRSATPDAVGAALRTEPALDGTVIAGNAPNELLFVPRGPLAPATTYRVWLQGLRDADGVAFDAPPQVSLTTVGAPSVVRFRPRDGTRGVDRAAVLSVRFTERMDRAKTAAAFHVTADGKPVAGRTSWAEAGRVLVFDPTDNLPFGSTVTMTVDAVAVSKAGVALAAASSGTFKVVPKPASAPAPKPKQPATKPISKSGGGGAVSGSWRGVEAYYLKLMNCTRTGGWVTSKGACSSPGGRNVAALWISSAISDRVSRPYAKLLATRGLCDHFIGGTPGDRLRRAGFTSYKWAENLGCRSGNPYTAVLGSHLYFQSEKPYNGGHYVNLMNPLYDRVGIGVWVYAKRVRLVVDFYRP